MKQKADAMALLYELTGRSLPFIVIDWRLAARITIGEGGFEEAQKAEARERLSLLSH